MIDINRIRENKEQVREALLKRMEDVNFDELLNWDKMKKELSIKIDELRAKRNKVSSDVPRIKKENGDIEALFKEMEMLREEINAGTVKIKELEEKIKNFLDCLPNIPDDDVVAGDKEQNEVISTYLEKPTFNFKAKDHVELCKNLHLIDYERGVKLSGNGSWIYTGMGARLEWAVLNYLIDTHIEDNYQFVLPPHMLNYECGYTAGQFPKFNEDVYWIDGGFDTKSKFLLPTAETALVNLHRDETLSIDCLPKKYFAYTPCYRREAGSSRVEERGMIRGHQFNKVELVQYTTEETSGLAFEELVHKVETLVQNLGLHYQLTKLAAGDVSGGMCRTYDLEVWIPSMGIYKEVSSISNSRDYQARRGNMKYKDPVTGKNKYLHTLNASGLATSRLIPAILEQYQQEDGSVKVPDVLKPYLKVDYIK
ncbi:MAG: serine--tRNA ligase [bacterium]|nr:serine--tRNA ligase [bacterium]